MLFGRDGQDDFSLHSVGSKPGRDCATSGAHVAFRAWDEASVDRWHAAAAGEGGIDNRDRARRRSRQISERYKWLSQAAEFTQAVACARERATAG